MDTDPCEHHDVAAQNPEVVKRLTKRLAEYQATVQEQICGRDDVDPEGHKETNQCGCWPVKQGDGGLSSWNSSWAPCDLPLGAASRREQALNE